MVGLNSAGDVALRETREIVKRVVEFNDFSRCWPNDQTEATGLVAKVKELVNVQDTFTRLQNTYASQQEEKKKKRQLEEAIRLEQLKQNRKTKQEIISELNVFNQETDIQRRGSN